MGSSHLAFVLRPDFSCFLLSRQILIRCEKHFKQSRLPECTQVCSQEEHCVGPAPRPQTPDTQPLSSSPTEQVRRTTYLTLSAYAPLPFSRSLSKSSLGMWGSPLLAPRF